MLERQTTYLLSSVDRIFMESGVRNPLVEPLHKFITAARENLTDPAMIAEAERLYREAGGDATLAEIQRRRSDAVWRDVQEAWNDLDRKLSDLKERGLAWYPKGLAWDTEFASWGNKPDPVRPSEADELQRLIDRVAETEAAWKKAEAERQVAEREEREREAAARQRQREKANKLAAIREANHDAFMRGCSLGAEAINDGLDEGVVHRKMWELGYREIRAEQEAHPARDLTARYSAMNDHFEQWIAAEMQKLTEQELTDDDTPHAA